MKKLISLILALTMIAAMAAGCAGNNETTANTTEAPVETTEAPVETTEAPIENEGEIDIFEEGEITESAMQKLANDIIAVAPVEFMGGLMPLDVTDTSEDGLLALTAYTGLANADKIVDAAAYESMMGVQAFSLVLVQVKDAAEAKNVAEEMKANIDPRKWICVGADEVMAAGAGDTVMFIMVDSGLGLSAQTYVDAFKTVVGADLDFTI